MHWYKNTETLYLFLPKLLLPNAWAFLLRILLIDGRHGSD